MKRILFFVLLLTGYSVMAQNTYIGKSDPEATTILKKISSKYQAYKSLTAKVSLTVENGQGQKVLNQAGALYLQGKKYYIQMGNGASFSDGSSIYNYDKDAKEVQITRYNPDDNMITPQKLFTDFYKKDFLYKLNEDRVENGRTIQEVELTPVDKTQVYFKVLLEVDRATRSIVGAKVFEKNGNKYIYTITNQKSNTAIPDSKFIFNAKDYPGAEVIDLR